MNRRKFLQSLAVAGTASFLSPGRTFANSGANDRINLAIIGCGRQAGGNIGNTLAVAGRYNARFVAACDVDRKRLANRVSLIAEGQGGAGDLTSYTDFRELLERPDIDAVLISTPDHSHGMVALTALRAGKDVYIEKPLTYGIREGRALVDAVRENGRILQVGSQQRSSVYFRRVCELARSGRLGELQALEAVLPRNDDHGDPGPLPVPEHLDYERWLEPGEKYPYSPDRVHPVEGFGVWSGWRWVSVHGRGTITDWGAHMVDNAIWGMGLEEGSPFTVKGEAAFPDRGLYDNHTDLDAELRLPGGVVMRVRTSAEESPHVRFEGSEGWARAWRGGFEGSDRELLLEPDADYESLLGVSDNHYANWLAAIRSREAPVAPAWDGHLTNTLCVAALAACKKAPGEELSWNPETEEFDDRPEANEILNL